MNKSKQLITISESVRIEESSGIKVVWTDRDYKEHSKVFKNSKLGSPDEAENKARQFSKKLEGDENIRSVSMVSIEESRNPDPSPELIMELGIKHGLLMTPTAKVPYTVTKKLPTGYDFEKGTIEVKVGDRVIVADGAGRDYEGYFLDYAPKSMWILLKNNRSVLKIPNPTVMGHANVPKGGTYVNNYDVNSKFW